MTFVPSTDDDDDWRQVDGKGCCPRKLRTRKEIRRTASIAAAVVGRPVRERCRSWVGEVEAVVAALWIEKKRRKKKKKRRYRVD